MLIKELEQSIEFDTLKSDWSIQMGIMQSSSGSIVWPQSQMSFTTGITDGVMRLETTEWSFSQLCRRLRIPVSYMRLCPHTLRDININYWLTKEDNSQKSLLVRAYNGKARAILSDRYVPIANSTVLQAVQDTVDTQNRYKILVSPDYIYLKIQSMHTPDGLYGMGVVIQNGEIGDYAFRIAPFIQRHSCSNSIVFLDGGFYMRHTSESSLPYLRATIKEKVRLALNLTPKYLDAFVDSETQQIPDISSVIDHICAMKGYNSDVKTKIIVGTEGKSTKAAVANGLSYAAHEVQDDRLSIDLESAAGYYLLGKINVAEEDLVE